MEARKNLPPISWDLSLVNSLLESFATKIVGLLTSLLRRWSSEVHPVTLLGPISETQKRSARPTAKRAATVFMVHSRQVELMLIY